MKKNTYEAIEHAKAYPAKIFITSVDNSSFHWHYDYELIVLLKGRLEIYCGTNPLQMKERDICLINCKSVHGYRASQGDNLCLFIQFSPTIFASEKNSNIYHYFYLNSVNNEYPPKNGYQELIRSACLAGWYSRKENTVSPFRLQSILYKLFADLLECVEHDLRRAVTSNLEKDNNLLAADISTYVDAHCDDQHLLQTLSTVFSVSEKTLYRCLKNKLGVSTKELIDNARIEKSKKLLRTTGISILDISDQCGLVSMSTFYRVFKKAVGITPKEYRDGQSASFAVAGVQGYLRFNEYEADYLLASHAKIC